MIDHDSIDPLAYVTATAPLIGLRLSAERHQQLAEAFALVMRVAKPALDTPVPTEIEPAPVFEA
jgi:hypothetical protein